MTRTRISYLDLRDVRSCGQRGVFALRMMLAFNDIAYANTLLGGILSKRETDTSELPDDDFGHALYFMRMQAGHLVEAIELIDDLSADACLVAWFCERGSTEMQQRFDKLGACRERQPGYADFKKYVKDVRRKASFHYDQPTVQAAIICRSKKSDGRRVKITQSESIRRARYNAADRVLDTMVCRRIWNIPMTANVRSEANRISAYTDALCEAFLAFAAEFIELFVGDLKNPDMKQ